MNTRVSVIHEIILRSCWILSLASLLFVGCHRETEPKVETDEQLSRNIQNEILESSRFSREKDFIVDEANSIADVVEAIRNLRIDSVRIVQGDNWVSIPSDQGDALIECLENVEIFKTNDSGEYIALPSKFEFQFVQHQNGADVIPLSVNIMTDREIFVGHLFCTTENPLTRKRLSELRALGISMLSEKAKESDSRR